MTAPTVSKGLIEWASKAGYAFTREDDSGAAIFWSNPGGEIRYYLRTDRGGGITLTSAERGSAEQFEIFTCSVNAMERYLLPIIGIDLRSKKGLRRIKTPRTIEEVAEGYRVGEADSEGYRNLYFPSGEVAARSRGRTNSIPTLTELSHFLQASEADLRNSYEDPDGRPLFET